MIAMEKRKPHHDLNAIQDIFARGNGRMTRTAILDAQAMGYGQTEMIAVIMTLSTKNFTKSVTAHNPQNSKNWHDYYFYYDDDFELNLFIKFAGEFLDDLILTSFKEA